LKNVSLKTSSLSRARLAKERGTIKKDWGGRIAIALAYPNYYRIAISNLGFQTVYALFNKNEKVVAERVFLPESEEIPYPYDKGIGLLSLESRSPLQRFDLVAFSLSFENDYPNILKILKFGKIPLLSEERNENHPLIMAGGMTTFLNPEPLTPFFDFFLLGEAEPVLDKFIETFFDIRKFHPSKKGFLKGLIQHLKSIYVPSLYHVEYHKDGTIKSMEPKEKGVPEKIEVAHHDLPQHPVNISTIITDEMEFADRILIELGRGCGRSCRFCAAGYVYRPPRFHKESKLITAAGAILEEHNRLALLSPCVADIPGIENITDYIINRGATFSVSSLRADSLTRELLDHLKRAGQKSLTIAPEAGSERLRKVINKHLTKEHILRAARLIAMTKDFTLKLYFLIGLPTETNNDVAEISELIKSIKHNLIKESSTRGKIGRMKLSVNCFVPKPFTPFQWFPMENVSILKEKQKWLRKTLSREGGVKVSFDVPKWAYIQSLLALGDRRVGSILLLAHEHNENWNEVFRFTELNPDFFVYRPKALDEILPWDFIDNGLLKEYMIKEYILASKAIESDVCRIGECTRCGVCKS